ncbi:DNA ligase 1 [Gracilaria domingensis]|nr:DNA ligase 1 [Gracilaria domingensis]
MRLRNHTVEPHRSFPPAPEPEPSPATKASAPEPEQSLIVEAQRPEPEASTAIDASAPEPEPFFAIEAPTLDQEPSEATNSASEVELMSMHSSSSSASSAFASSASASSASASSAFASSASVAHSLLFRTSVETNVDSLAQTIGSEYDSDSRSLSVAFDRAGNLRGSTSLPFPSNLQSFIQPISYRKVKVWSYKEEDIATECPGPDDECKELIRAVMTDVAAGRTDQGLSNTRGPFAAN